MKLFAKFTQIKSIVALSSALLCAAQTGAATSLSDSLPYGAVATLESKESADTLTKLVGLADGILSKVDDSGEISEIAQMFGDIVSQSIGQDAVASLYEMSGEPQILLASKVSKELADSDIVADFLPEKQSLKVGSYTFGYDGVDIYAGMSQGLVYMSTNKYLLEAYLKRLSGVKAPTMGNTRPYRLISQERGEQALSFFVDFTTLADWGRTLLKEIKMPRLLSPIVDAVDTLGRFSAGFTATPEGISAKSALLANKYGKDQPLYNILTHSSNSKLQNIIPANVEQASMYACHSDLNGYLGRWLTRFDLLDPTGLLTDSQMASNLEKSALYLGDECGSAILAGGTKASLNVVDSTAPLRYMVAYQRVDDMQAAKQHMPAYVAAWNSALKNASKEIKNMSHLGDLLDKGLPGGNKLSSRMGLGLSSLTEIETMFQDLELNYGFKDGYLVMAFSKDALQSALQKDDEPTLASSPKFTAELANLGLADQSQQAAKLNSWIYAPKAVELSAEDFDQIFDEVLETLDEDTEDMELLAALGMFSDALADLDARYGGSATYSQVMDDLVVGYSKVKYRW